MDGGASALVEPQTLLGAAPSANVIVPPLLMDWKGVQLRA
jgi:hypothetical protein